MTVKELIAWEIVIGIPIIIAIIATIYGIKPIGILISILLVVFAIVKAVFYLVDN